MGPLGEHVHRQVSPFPHWGMIAKADRKNYQDFENSRPVTTTTLGPAPVLLGHDDFATDDEVGCYSPNHEFGWDNEHPCRIAEVPRFKIEYRPITNGQYHHYWKHFLGSVHSAIPKSWVLVGTDVHVRTLYGPLLLDHAYYWPVIASYDELNSYAGDCII